MSAKINIFLTDLLGTPTTVQGVDINLLRGISLEKLYVTDSGRDTLVFINELEAGIRYFDYDKNYLSLNTVLLDSLVFNLRADSLGELNLMAIIDRFSSGDTTQTEGADFKLTCPRLKIQRSHFRYQTSDLPWPDNEMDFADLDIEDLNIELLDIYMLNDSIRCDVREIRLKEKCGFKLNEFSGPVTVSGTGVYSDQLHVQTGESNLSFNQFKFSTTNWESYSDFLNAVELSLEVTPGSELKLDEINYFAGQVIPLKRNIRLQGGFTGTVSSFSVNNFLVGFGESGKLRISGSSFGLPEAESTFWNMTIDTLRANTSDIEWLLADVAGKLPASVLRLGDINAKGKMQGMTFDMVADLNMLTKAGRIETDIKIKQRTNTELEIKGNTAIHNFKIGRLLQIDKLKTIEMKDTILLVYNTESGGFFLDNKGLVDSLIYNGYTYKQIDLIGELQNKNFSGRIRINDPNLNFQLDGLINLNEQIPQFSFEAKAGLIDFRATGIDTTNKVSRLNFALKTKFSGSHLDNIMGAIQFDTICYQNDNGRLPFDTLGLYIGKSQGVKELTLTSDYFAAYINGNFNFSTIDKAFLGLAYNFFPILSNAQLKQLENGLISDNVLIDKQYNTQDTLQNFTFDVELGGVNKIVKHFIPKAHIADYTVCSGYLNSSDRILKFNFESDSLGIGEQYMSKIHFSLDVLGSYMVANSTAKRLNLTNGLELVDLKTYMQAQALDNRLSLLVDWDNKSDSLNFAGNINLDFEANKSLETDNINFITQVNPSFLQVDNNRWLFDEATILIDTTSIWFQGMKFSSGEQSIAIEGKVSQEPTELLNVDISNFNLMSLNPLLRSYSTSLGGVLNGNVAFADLLNVPTVLTSDSVRDFSLNQIDLGNLQFNTEWDGNEKNLIVSSSIYSKVMNRNTFEVHGEILPFEKKMNIDANLYKFEVATFTPFVEGIASELEGSISGQLKVDSTFESPRISGIFGVNRVRALVDYLGTKYTIQEDTIQVENQYIGFRNAVVNDPRGQRALMDMRIDHDLFSNILLNLHLSARNFQVLSTTEIDNELFYGKAFVTGDVKISGPTDQLEINVQARSERNTQINIPLSSSGSVSDFDFIRFDDSFDNNKTKTEFNQDYQVDLSGLKLHLNLDVTPDAEIQIIMDKKVGDIIKAKGDGSISMNIDTKGDFTMFGEYIIDKGDYLFTLKNLINKKFIVKKGGTITWNGDPLDANLNLETAYQLERIPLKNFYTDDESFKDKKVSVDCGLTLRGKLATPSIDFKLSIDDPDSRIDEDFRKLTDEELNKQFLSLLVMNRFQPMYGGFNQALSGSGNSDLLSSNATELISSQLSVWLSQMSDAFDMNVKLKSGSQNTQSEIEVGVSTNFLNERLSIQLNGNMNMGQTDQVQTDQNQNNEFEGDYELNYKITRSGKTRVKYYGRANQVISYNKIPFMQGVGILYREDFNSVAELLQKYKDALDNRREKRKEQLKADKESN